MTPEAEAQRQDSLIEAKLDEVAEETGYPRFAVNWIYRTVIYHSLLPKPEGATRQGLSAEELCATLMRRANDVVPGGFRLVLEYNGLLRSEDIGTIVNSLVNRELLQREEDDYFTDFDGLYTIDNLGAFLDRQGIKLNWVAPGAARRAAIVLCLMGAAVALGNWLHPQVIPNAFVGPVLVFAGIVILAWSKYRTMMSKRDPLKRLGG
jgi:uncharacterized repeat protein (TIGR04138 family)